MKKSYNKYSLVAGLAATLMVGCGSTTSDVVQQIIQQNQANVPPAAAVRPLSFLTDTLLRTAEGPVVVASVDLNKDGKLDLVFGGRDSSGSMSVHIGKGNGTFQDPRIFEVGNHPHGFFFSDFNGDNHLDVAIALRNNNLYSVALGDGQGGFSDIKFLPSSDQPWNVTGGDFNGDGNTDLAFFGRNNANRVAVHLGDGSGNFGNAADFSTPDSGEGIKAALVNNDAILDLVVTEEGNNRIGVLLGNGDGTFAPTNSFSTSGSRPRDVALTDLNGDTFLDAVVANYNSDDISVLLGDGAGNFGAAVTFATNGDEVRYLALADYNKDGRTDVATGNSAQNFPDNASLLFGNGDGTFQPGVDLLRGGSITPAITNGDYDGDGDVDLVLGLRQGNSATLALNDGTGNFPVDPNVIATFNAGNNERDARLFDMNKDGKLDLVVANRGPRSSSPGFLAIALGNGNGTFQPANTFAAGIASNALEVADFNQDGQLDVAVGNARNSPHTSIFLGNGDGTVGVPQNIDLGAGDPGASEFAAADYDKDGDLDIIQVINFGNVNQNHIFLLRNDGAGVFTSAPVGFGGDDLIDIETTDFNGDGNPDFVVCDQYDDLTLFLGRGDGTFSLGENISFAGTDQVQGVELADLNGDGRLDIVASNDGGGNLAFVTSFLSQGDGKFVTGQLVPFLGEFSRGMTLADFNRDGSPDLVVSDQNGGGIIGFSGLGNGNFAPPQYFGGGGHRTVFAGDVDGDGDPDIVGANPEGGDIRIITNNLP